MTAILALLPTLIGLIPTITTGLSVVIKFIADVRTAAQQTSQWTPELEKQFVDALILKGSSDAWKTDAEIKSSV